MSPNGPSRNSLLAGLAPLVVSIAAGAVGLIATPVLSADRSLIAAPTADNHQETGKETGKYTVKEIVKETGKDTVKDPSKAAVAPLPPKAKPPVHHETLREATNEAATKASVGDYLGAINVWSRLIQHGPDRLQGYLQRAKLKRHIGDHKGALQDLDLALQSYPRNVSCLLERAAIRRRLNDNHGALEDLNRAIEAEPHKAEPYVDRGWLKMAMGDYVGSYTDYHAAITINPKLKSKLTAMGQPQVSAHLDMGENGISAQSERIIDRSQGNENTNSSDNIHAHHGASYGNNYGSNYGSHFGSGKSAKTTIKRITSATQLAHLNNEAVKEINAGQFDAAVKTLHELIDSAPDYAHARDNLTIAHNNWGLELAKRTPALAAGQFRQALYLDPSQGASRRNLDAMIKEIGKNPHDPADRLTLARESLASGDKEGAFVEATEAIKLKNSAEVRYVLRNVLNALNDDDVDDDDRALSRRPEKSPEKTRARAAEQTAEKNAAIAPTLPPGSGSSHQDNPTLIDQARALAADGHVGNAEELLNKLINEIKSRAAIDESSDFGTLEQALDTISEMYLKTGSYNQAQEHLQELVSLRESTRAHDDPVLGNTYRQYARVLKDLGRTADAKAFEEKAEAIFLQRAPQSPTPPAVLLSSPIGN